METFNTFALARALHVLGVVLWIGGVAFVTTVLLPGLRRIEDAENRLELFEKLERRFSFQAKMATVVTGISGFYMLDVMDAWNRYQFVQFWWLHLMTFVWLLFTVVLFFLEPFFLHEWFHKKASEDSEAAFRFIQRMHRVLLVLSLLAVFGAVAGAHGLNFL